MLLLSRNGTFKATSTYVLLGPSCSSYLVPRLALTVFKSNHTSCPYPLKPLASAWGCGGAVWMASWTPQSTSLMTYRRARPGR